MTGKELKSKLDKLGVNYAEMAKAIGFTNRQGLNQKFSSKDITVSLLVRIADYVNKNIYFFIEGKPPEMRVFNEPEVPYGTNVKEIERLKNIIDVLTDQIKILKKKPIVSADQETTAGVESKLNALLEAIAEVGSGKRWHSKEEAIAALGKSFYFERK